MNDGRKIPRSLENPIDNVIIDFSSFINPTLRGLGITPNMLTTASLLTGLLAALLAWVGYYYLAAFTVLISYVFDCMDGNMARMFKMVTPFGDWYDHISDILKYSFLYVVILTSSKLSRNFKVAFSSITITIMIFMYIHFGCQEKSYAKNEKDSLSSLEKVCPNSEYIRYTRYVGSGTWVCSLIIFLLIAAS